MPRKSPEERSFSLFRAAAIPPAPPADLDPKSAQLWRSIVSEHPGDFWNSGSLRLLLRFCRTSTYVEKLHDYLELQEIGTKEARDTHKLIIQGNASMAGMASKLRLSQQSTIHRRSGHLSEGGSLDDHGGLLGGRALHQ